MKRLVKDLIRQKALWDFAKIEPEASIIEALYILERTKSSALLVIKDDELKGIFSEKDFAHASLFKGIQLTAKVESVMSTKIYFAEPAFTLEDCLQVMSKVHVRHLPVIENRMPIALLSMRHIVEVLVEDKNAQIRELTTYITGSSQGIDSNQERRISKVPIYHATQNQEAI